MNLHETELRHQAIAYEKQQKEIEKLETFIAKIKHVLQLLILLNQDNVF